MSTEEKKAAKAAWYRSYREQRLEQERARSRRWIKNNREKALAASKRYRGTEKGLQARARYRNKQREKMGLPALSATRPMVRLSPEQKRAKQRLYDRARRAKNGNFAFAHRLRNRLLSALRRAGFIKSNHSYELIGCSIPEFKRYIETLFLPGMTWENRKEWHLDHKIPLAAFDLLDVEQQKKAFHWSNFQPLWKADNWRKNKTLRNPSV